MILRNGANDTRPIYLANQKEVEEIKKEYAWWYEVTASSVEAILVYKP